MPEIGSSLREARMRAKIDITEVEQATKIRAKYLRAIENEEWGLLPGSTFAKSFIRTYADYLGLDSRSLVEEYKLRYERPSESELRTLSPGPARSRGGRAGRGGIGAGGGGLGGGGARVPPWLVVVGVVAVILVALWAVGSLGGSDDDGGGQPTTSASETRTTPHRGARRAQRRRQQRPAPPTQAGVRLIPTGDVYVCLVDQDGAVLIPGTIYRAGQAVPLRRSAAMRITLGNSNVQMRVNGRPVAVPASSTAIGFELTTAGARRLPEDQAPTCA